MQLKFCCVGISTTTLILIQLINQTTASGGTKDQRFSASFLFCLLSGESTCPVPVAVFANASKQFGVKVLFCDGSD